MLRFSAVLKNGEIKEIAGALTVVFNMDMRVPADSVALTCPFDSGLRSADRLEAFDGEQLVFKGQLDQIETVKRGSGVILKLVARSMAAALLDNEAEPVTYLNPSETLINNKHLKPFGIETEESRDTPYFDKLSISKGMSHWQVVESFCRNRYGSVPRISADGKAYLKGVKHSETTVFSDKRGGIVYYSLKESSRRYRLISEVRLKFYNLNAYDSVLKNNYAGAKRVNRVRYINAASDKTTASTAEKIIENGNRDSYALTLSCIGCHIGVFGKNAVVNDSVLGLVEGLTVRSVSYTAGSSGEHTVITLEREIFNVADELHNKKLD